MTEEHPVTVRSPHEYDNLLYKVSDAIARSPDIAKIFDSVAESVRWLPDLMDDLTTTVGVMRDEESKMRSFGKNLRTSLSLQGTTFDHRTRMEALAKQADSLASFASTVQCNASYTVNEIRKVWILGQKIDKDMAEILNQSRMIAGESADYHRMADEFLTLEQS